MKRELNINETQVVSLEILKKIAEICEKRNLKYYLMYGTLIGAVRHEGFIPWDDDLDIMMPRNDYDKLIEYLLNNMNELKNLKIFNHETCKNYPYMITRVSDDRYSIKMENEKDFGMGIFIDIYPYDGLGNTREEALKFAKKGDHLSSLCYQATRKRYAIETTTSLWKKIMKAPVFVFAKMCGKNIFQDKLSKLARVKEYDQSNYVGCITWLSGGEKDIFKREWFDDFEKVKFENYYFRIPKEYDKILTHIYGDYMKLPSPEDRIGHHFYKAFKK